MRACAPFGRSIPLVGVLLMQTLLAGCGARPYPVAGKLVFEDAKPATELAGYTIDFESETPRVSASGVVADDGSFTVGTTTPSDGAMPSTYRVALNPPLADDDRPRRPAAIA